MPALMPQQRMREGSTGEAPAAQPQAAARVAPEGRLAVVEKSAVAVQWDPAAGLDPAAREVALARP